VGGGGCPHALSSQDIDETMARSHPNPRTQSHAHVHLPIAKRSGSAGQGPGRSQYLYCDSKRRHSCAGPSCRAGSRDSSEAAHTVSRAPDTAAAAPRRHSKANKQQGKPPRRCVLLLPARPARHAPRCSTGCRAQYWLHAAGAVPAQTEPKSRENQGRGVGDWARGWVGGGGGGVGEERGLCLGRLALEDAGVRWTLPTLHHLRQCMLHAVVRR
jgi:hypothetical protein